jgi:prepilin-type N-terminal cleavage/methylation domain-containing protein
MNELMSKETKRGFTLIELLVVIAIIGILASVVLASLNSARSKGSDAAVKSNLSNARAEAELYYDTNGSYANVCSATSTNGIGDNQAAAEAAGNNGGDCDSTASTWYAWAGLASSSTRAWCVDYKGTAKEIAKPGGGGGTMTACP